MRSLLNIFTIVVVLLVEGRRAGRTEEMGMGLETEERVAKRDNVTLKAPIVGVPSQHWEGVDGTWSTFEIRVGTPTSTYRVLPATSWQETWVVYGAAANVCNTSAGVPSDCQEKRGGVFDSAKSDTWEMGGQYDLGLNQGLGYSGVGQYGFDTVGIGYDTSQGPTLKHQIISEVASGPFWFGIFGMGFQPTNFSGYGNPQASFADTLYSNGSISSMSWGYTAGAYYRLKSVFGSMIFGGYDASRFTPNNVIFTMTGDVSRDIVVTIRSITSTTSSGKTTLMSTPEFAFIDSTVPELWLPVTVCQAFESAFGLTLDTKSNLYLINASTHTSLQNLNPNITITLGNQKSGGETVDLVLPYAAFDLNISAPALPNASSLYFPIRRASDASQYTLGRTFLQEVYVTTHYNSRTFNVSQAIFDDTVSARIIALPPTLPTPGSTTNTTSNPSSPRSGSKKSLSGGAIAGIVVGSLLFLVLLIALIFLFLRRRKSHKAKSAAAAEAAKHPTYEIDSGRRVDPAEQSAYNGQASKTTQEADGEQVVEKWGVPIMVPQELEAGVPGREREMRVGRTPMAELGEGEGGLAEVEREGEEREEDLVSPNTGTMRSEGVWSGRDRPVSEATWSPSTPVQRRGSRFEERWDDQGYGR